MSAAVESMFYAGDVPWHGLGTALPANVSWQDGLVAAGLNWDVRLEPVFRMGPDDFERLDDYREVRRSTDDATFGIVGDGYTPVQNREAFQVFEYLFGSAAVLHTAGSLHNGRVVWGLAELPGDWTIAGEQHRRYLLCTTTHDGSGALRAYATAVRVVCANTLNASKGDSRDGISVRHTGKATDRLRDKSAVLAQAFGQFDAYAKRMERLTQYRLADPQSDEILAALFPGDQPRHQDNRAFIKHLAVNGAGNAAWAGTAYGLFQGITDYVDHAKLRGESGRNPARRFASSLLGAGAIQKAQALQSIERVLQAA